MVCIERIDSLYNADWRFAWSRWMVCVIKSDVLDEKNLDFYFRN